MLLIGLHGSNKLVSQQFVTNICQTHDLQVSDISNEDYMYVTNGKGIGS